MRKDEVFHGILLTPERDVIFGPFKNGLANGNGYKISTSTGELSCLRFVIGYERERNCHTNQVTLNVHDNSDFYEGEVIEQRKKQVMHGLVFIVLLLAKMKHTLKKY